MSRCLSAVVSIETETGRLCVYQRATMSCISRYNGDFHCPRRFFCQIDRYWREKLRDSRKRPGRTQRTEFLLIHGSARRLYRSRCTLYTSCRVISSLAYPTRLLSNWLLSNPTHFSICILTTVIVISFKINFIVSLNSREPSFLPNRIQGRT